MTYDPTNPFARIIRGELPCHRVYDDDDFLVIMDIMPQAPGHVIILAKSQTVNVLDADDAVLARLLPLARRLGAAAVQAMAADGVTMFVNNGDAGGQSVFHLHFHIVPRKRGAALVTHGGRGEKDAVLSAQAASIARYLVG